MAQATVDKTALPRSPLEIIVDRIWRFFCSVRAAVVEIAILAVLVLIGTLRGSDAPQWLANAIPATQPFVDRWYAWDVFGSLPFIGILTLLSIAIAVCTINRVPGIWNTIANPTVRTSRGFLRSADLSATYQNATPPEALLDDLSTSLKQQRFRVITERHGEETHLYADKNRYAKLATFPFHLALILILVGGIVGGRYGFRENEFLIPEGSVREVGHGTGLSVELVQFRDSWREDGTPAEYRSDLVLYEDGQPVQEKSITVNNPMSHGMVTFYQASYGQAATLRVTDDEGRTLFDDSVPLGLYTHANNPDAPAGVQVLPQAGVQLNVIAPDNNRANAPELDTLNLRSGQMYVQVREIGPNASDERPSAAINMGETARIGNFNVEFVRESRFTLLQVASNPGIPIFWVASLLLVAGLAITFYFPNRRIRGILSMAPGSSGSQLELAPLAKRDWSAKREFKIVAEKLADTLQTSPMITERASVSDTSEVSAEGRASAANDSRSTSVASKEVR
jgi:cytochrome c biogenesis protein